MELYLLWIFVGVFFNKFTPVTTGFNIKSAIFKVHKKHPAVRKCAEEMLANNSLVVGRITNLKDHCEKLTTYHDNPPQTTEQWEGYFEKEYIRTHFASSVKGAQYRAVAIPRPLQSGSKIMLTLNNSQPDVMRVGIDRSGGELLNNEDRLFRILIFTYKFIAVDTMTGNQYIISFDLKDWCPHLECKITIIIHEERLEFHLNDKAIGTLQALPYYLGQMRYVRPDKLGADISVFEFEK